MINFEREMVIDFQVLHQDAYVSDEMFTLPGMSFPPQEQSGNKHTSFRHLAAVLSGVG